MEDRECTNDRERKESELMRERKSHSTPFFNKISFFISLFKNKRKEYECIHPMGVSSFVQKAVLDGLAEMRLNSQVWARKEDLHLEEEMSCDSWDPYGHSYEGFPIEMEETVADPFGFPSAALEEELASEIVKLLHLALLV